MPHPPPAGSPPPSDPTKPFYLPKTFLGKAAALPAQILFAILGMLGIATWARQIVRVVPRVPGLVALRGQKTEDGEGESVAAWVDRNVPSLKETFTPSWWLPK